MAENEEKSLVISSTITEEEINKIKAEIIKNITKLQRDRQHLKKYGVCCAICGKSHKFLKRGLSVDRNDLTKEDRGLLCDKCNLGLNFFDADLIGDLFLIKASEYINKYCPECKENK